MMRCSRALVSTSTWASLGSKAKQRSTNASGKALQKEGSSPLRDVEGQKHSTLQHRCRYARDCQRLPHALAGVPERPSPQVQMLRLRLIQVQSNAALSSNAPHMVHPAYLHMCSNCA